MAADDRGSWFARFAGNPPVQPASVNAFERATGLKLPNEYLSFLSRCNGGEGPIGSHYFVAWPVEDLIRLNDLYKASEFAPGLVLFGSNGAGEAFGFDSREETIPIVAIPFVGLDWADARRIANGFDEFLNHLLVSRDLI